MNEYYLLLLLVLSCNGISDSVFSNLKENVRSLLDSSGTESGNLRRGLKTSLQEKGNAKLVSKNTGTTISTNKNIGRSYFHVDPVFDSLKNRRLWQKSKSHKASSTTSESSEIEMQFWMEDWGEHRENEKAKAFNASILNAKDTLNMKMARPSGVPCGDPNQHDLPWGVCLKPAECHEEYRIYRGDSSCGRNRYVCCAVIETAYDMYDAPDLSFEHDNSLTTDSDLERVDTHEEKHREFLLHKHEKTKAKRTKMMLKKRIRHSITNVINEITKLVQRGYKNATSQRRLKAQQLMDFVKQMKKQYRKDRQSLVDAHQFDIMKSDLALQANLDKIHSLNVNFMTNDTFRDIVVNGTVNKKELRKLQRTHPVLSLFYKNRRMGGDMESQHTGKEEPEIDEDAPETEIDEPDIEEFEPEIKKQPSKPLDYDVEVGVLYY